MSIIRVAKRAGVSVATVSRVINRFPGVRPQTVKQVREAMKELLYVPSAIRPGPKPGSRRPARLRSRLGSIMVLTVGQTWREWLTLPVFAQVFAGIAAAAKGRHLKLLVDEMPDPHQVSGLIAGGQVDGAIVFCSSRLGRGDFESLRQHPVPLVRVMGPAEGPAAIDQVTTDNGAVGHLAHRYLGECGCREMAFVAEYPAWPLMRMRGHGCANAARDDGHGVTSYVVSDNPAVIENYGPRVQAASSLGELVSRMASGAARPRGIFSATDLLTLKLYPLLQARGLVPGRDVTVVSCDNQTSLLSMLAPRPASIDLRPEEIGPLAVARLVHRLEHPDEPALEIQVPPKVGPCEPAGKAACDGRAGMDGHGH